MTEQTHIRSCFSTALPNLQTAWDSTTLGLLKTCPRKYQLNMILGYQEKDRIHLDFGIAYHVGLETHAKLIASGTEPELALRQSLVAAMKSAWDNGMARDNTYKNVANLCRAIIGNIDTYASNPAVTTHILRDGRAAVELSFKINLDMYSPDGEPYILCGHLDRVVEFNGKLYVLDYKTSTYALSENYFANYSPNNQMTLYNAAASAILDRPVSGFIVDAVQILVNGERYHREIITRPPECLEEWLSDLKIWIRQAELYAETGQYPMNDTACSMYGGCEYRNVCAAHPKVRPIILNGGGFDIRVGDKAWNPLVER